MPNLIHLPGVAGTDEAGRGSLAGPVIVAAVVLPEGFDIKGLNDSKKLTPERRESLAARIREGAEWHIESVPTEEIDRRNVLRASLDGMARALERVSFSKALVDGDWLPPINCCMEAVVKGDGKYVCIAAASILAKTERDRIMCDYALEYPQYGFDLHFGYGTAEHLAAIREHGPCPIHRRTFSPVSEMVNQPCLIFDE
ncbi:MAG TPA: ribonuclease HII [Fimbriimonadaceae bacterium]|nr:ribonuclease HII [Fimbriimonadaceae bacterium]